ncbi:hypothetical protein QTP70_003601 [Hemibagrus guttatus]|uniref:Uncharacterized protein n=1 Tax=Hemibagrus guttatus TaxID=175788 RepID=A0AAE0QYV8_9TELE|nr:hypothetical protein QTP70_003601 [Hemibagrus guttatus]KAK3562538.1 hypothetical protein QTP86_001716 [Hemibagrus guttatus]
MSGGHFILTAHQLKLNPSKTELLVIPDDSSPAQDFELSLNNSMIFPSAIAHHLGVRAVLMAEVMEGSAAAAAMAVPSASMDWQKRCIALEMQLLRFRLQAGKIRQLLAEKH